MFHLLSAESYKLRKSKSFYICMAVTAAMIFLVYVLLTIADKISSGQLENGTGGVVVTQNGDSVDAENGLVLDEVGVTGILKQLFTGDLMPCVIAVFVSIFVVGEYAGGMMKNIVGKGSRRGEIFCARLLVTEAAVILIYLAAITAVLVFGWMFLGKEGFAAQGFWSDLAVYTGLQLLMGIGLTAVFVLIGELSRGYAAGISLGIGAASLSVLFFGGLDLLCRNSAFTPSDYWLVTRSAACPMQGVSAGYIAGTFVVSAIWLILAGGLGMWHFCRADIR